MMVLRQADSADAAGIAALLESAADTGRIPIEVRYRPAYFARLIAHENVAFVVAETADAIVGVGMVRLDTLRREDGRFSPVATLSTLCVHPAWRGQGLGRRLAAWRIAWVDARAGPETPVVAGIQRGNRPSHAVATVWANGIAGALDAFLVPIRRAPARRADRRAPAFTMRVARGEALPAIAVQLTAYYRDARYAPWFSADTLQAWLDAVPGRRLLVAEDGVGRIRAGLAVTDAFRFQTLHVRHLPAWLATANRLWRVVPPDGIVRPLAVSHLWRAADAGGGALRALWEHLLTTAPAPANALVLYADRRSELPCAVGIPGWLPRGRLTLVCRTDRPIAPGRVYLLGQ